MTADRRSSPAGARVTDAGFTLTELVIVVFLLGLIAPVLAMAFTVVARVTPTAEDRTDDARSLLNLTTWISQDVSSTSEDGFYVGTSAPGGGCLASSLPSASMNLLELHWSEGTEKYVTNYRWLPTEPGKGQIVRYACQQGQAPMSLRLTPDLNEVATGQFTPAPVEITTTLDAGKSKGIQFVVLIYDGYGIQRELLSLDATTTNVMTTLPDGSGGSPGTNTAPTASDLLMTITPPATQSELLPATDADTDTLFVTFPNGVPGGWNLLAVGLTVQVTPDPAAAPGEYDITYRVTDPTGATADAILKVTISAVTPNQPPVANSVTIPASKSMPSIATLVFSDPEGETLTPTFDTSALPAGWTVEFVPPNQVKVTPSPSANGTTVIPYSVTDSLGAKATSQVTVNVCTVTLVSVTPNTVAVKNNGDLFSDVTVAISTNGACAPLVLGFLPNDTSAVESTVTFNASNVATIPKNSAYAWLRPALDSTRVVPLNVRQGANGPVELTTNLTTTR